MTNKTKPKEPKKPGKRGPKPKLKNPVRFSSFWGEQADHDWLAQQPGTMAEALRECIRVARELDKNSERGEWTV